MSPICCPWPTGRPPSYTLRPPLRDLLLELDRMEQGGDHAPDDSADRESFSAAWYVWRILARLFTPLASVAWVVYLFVRRNRYHDPELQDPARLAALVFVAICFVPCGFLCTLDDD